MTFHPEARSDFSLRASRLWESRFFPPRLGPQAKMKNNQLSIFCACLLSAQNTQKTHLANFWVKFSRTPFCFCHCSSAPGAHFCYLNVGVFTAKQPQTFNPSPSTHHHLLNEAKHHNGLNDVDSSFNSCSEIITNH